MNRLNTFIVATLLITFPFFSFGDKQKTFKIASVKGEAFLKKDGGEWKPLKKRMKISAGDWIKTGEKSRVKIKYGKSIILVAGDTTINLEKLAGKEEDDSVVYLLGGFIWSKIKKYRKKGENISFRTKTSVAGIRGTQFSLFQSGDKTIACVCEGEITIKSNNKSYNVTQGRGLIVDPISGATENDYSPYIHKGVFNEQFQTVVKKESSFNQCIACHIEKEKNSRKAYIK